MFEHDDEDVALRRLTAEERAVLDATELLCEVLEREGISRTELARRLEVTPGEITQRLRGRNLTVKSLAATLDALDCRLVLDAKPQGALTTRPIAWFESTERQSVETRGAGYDLPMAEQVGMSPLGIAV